MKRFRLLLVALVWFFVLPWHVPARCQTLSPDSVDAAHVEATAPSLTQLVLNSARDDDLAAAIDAVLDSPNAPSE